MPVRDYVSEARKISSWTVSDLVLLLLLLVINLTFTRMGPNTEWKEKHLSGSSQVLEVWWPHAGS